MKWNKWVVVFMALCTMLTVTSCLGDDDKYELSQDEMKQAMKAMKGTYTGKLKWQATSGVKYDSLNNVSYTVNDTAIIIHNFPVSSLAAGVLEEAPMTRCATPSRRPPHKTWCAQSRSTTTRTFSIPTAC